MDVEVLISLVQTYPELYNMRHHDYFNSTRRDNCWDEIGSIMKRLGADCRDRWVRVRDNHRKALQRRQTKSGAMKKTKPAKYEQELTFLLPHLTDGNIRQSNFAPSENQANPPSDCGEDAECNDPQELSAFFPLSTTPAHESTLVTVTKKKSFPAASPSDHSSQSASSSVNINRTSFGLKPRNRSRPRHMTIASVLESFLASKKTEQQKGNDLEDATTTYFMSMVKTIRSFPLRDQIEVKKKMYQVISDKEVEIALRSECDERQSFLSYPLSQAATHHATRLPSDTIPLGYEYGALLEQQTDINDNINTGKVYVVVDESNYK